MFQVPQATVVRSREHGERDRQVALPRCILRLYRRLTPQTKAAAATMNFVMAVFVALYCLGGGKMFQYLEMEHRQGEIDKELAGVLRCFDGQIRLWDGTHASNLSHSLLEQCTLEHLSLDNWFYLDSVVYAFTTVVTVGYDAIEPKTDVGRLFGVVFTILGIPFTMVLIGNFGKFLQEGATDIYVRVRKKYRLYQRRREQRQRQTQSALLRRKSTMTGGMTTSESRLTERSLIEPTGDLESGLHHQQHYGSTDPGHFETIVEDGQAVKVVEADEPDEDDDDDDEEDPPLFTVLLLMVVAYVITGTVMWPLLDGLRFVPSIYYSVMTVTALDFGMIFRGSAFFVPMKLFYALVGLALVTVAIDAGSEYLRKLHFIGKKVDYSKQKIWVGGQKITMKNMIMATCKQNGVALDKIQNIDFDHLMRAAVAEEAGNPLPDPVEEEEIDVEDPKETKPIRHIDSTDVDTDHEPPPPGPPPPPPPSSNQQIDETNNGAFGYDNTANFPSTSADNDGGGAAHSPNSACFTTLPSIHEEPSDSSCTTTPEPQSITDTGIDTYSEADSCDVNDGRDDDLLADLIGDAWTPSPAPIGTPRLIHPSWHPDSTPSPKHVRLLHASWTPSPPQPSHCQLTSVLASSWQPDTPDCSRKRYPRVAWSELPDFSWSSPEPTRPVLQDAAGPIDDVELRYGLPASAEVNVAQSVSWPYSAETSTASLRPPPMAKHQLVPLITASLQPDDYANDDRPRINPKKLHPNFGADDADLLMDTGADDEELVRDLSAECYPGVPTVVHSRSVALAKHLPPDLLQTPLCGIFKPLLVSSASEHSASLNYQPAQLVEITQCLYREDVHKISAPETYSSASTSNDGETSVAKSDFLQRMMTENLLGLTKTTMQTSAISSVLETEFNEETDLLQRAATDSCSSLSHPGSLLSSEDQNNAVKNKRYESVSFIQQPCEEQQYRLTEAVGEATGKNLATPLLGNVDLIQSMNKENLENLRVGEISLSSLDDSGPDIRSLEKPQLIQLQQDCCLQPLFVPETKVSLGSGSDSLIEQHEKEVELIQKQQQSLLDTVVIPETFQNQIEESKPNKRIDGVDILQVPLEQRLSILSTPALETSAGQDCRSADDYVENADLIQNQMEDQTVLLTPLNTSSENAFDVVPVTPDTSEFIQTSVPNEHLRLSAPLTEEVSSQTANQQQDLVDSVAFIYAEQPNDQQPLFKPTTFTEESQSIDQPIELIEEVELIQQLEQEEMLVNEHPPIATSTSETINNDVERILEVDLVQMIERDVQEKLRAPIINVEQGAEQLQQLEYAEKVDLLQIKEEERLANLDDIDVNVVSGEQPQPTEFVEQVELVQHQCLESIHNLNDDAPDTFKNEEDELCQQFYDQVGLVQREETEQHVIVEPCLTVMADCEDQNKDSDLVEEVELIQHICNESVIPLEHPQPETQHDQPIDQSVQHYDEVELRQVAARDVLVSVLPVDALVACLDDRLVTVALCDQPTLIQMEEPAVLVPIYPPTPFVADEQQATTSDDFNESVELIQIEASSMLDKIDCPQTFVADDELRNASDDYNESVDFVQIPCSDETVRLSPEQSSVEPASVVDHAASTVCPRLLPETEVHEDYKEDVLNSLPVHHDSVANDPPQTSSADTSCLDHESVQITVTTQQADDSAHGSLQPQPEPLNTELISDDLVQLTKVIPDNALNQPTFNPTFHTEPDNFFTPTIDENLLSVQQPSTSCDNSSPLESQSSHHDEADDFFTPRANEDFPSVEQPSTYTSLSTPFDSQPKAVEVTDVHRKLDALATVDTSMSGEAPHVEVTAVLLLDDVVTEHVIKLQRIWSCLLNYRRQYTGNIKDKSFKDILETTMIPMFPAPPGRTGYTTSAEQRHAIYQQEWNKLRITRRTQSLDVLNTNKDDAPADPVQKRASRQKAQRDQFNQSLQAVREALRKKPPPKKPPPKGKSAGTNRLRPPPRSASDQQMAGRASRPTTSRPPRPPSTNDLQSPSPAATAPASARSTPRRTPATALSPSTSQTLPRASKPATVTNRKSRDQKPKGGGGGSTASVKL